MQVSQIFLSDDGAELSPFLGHAIGTVQEAFPGANYQLYTKETLRDLLRTTMAKKWWRLMTPSIPMPTKLI